MEDDKKPAAEPGGGMTHQPLPYLVRVRTMADEDSMSRSTEHRVVAYSLMEAAMQAIMESGGVGLGGEKQKVEFIGPDLDAYARLFGQSLFAKVAR